MIGIAVLALALAAGWTLTRRRKSGNIVRLHSQGPFPPYDWFAKEQAPEDVYPPRSGPDASRA